MSNLTRKGGRGPNSDDRYRRLAAQVEYPEAWIPEKGETLTGQAVRWETVDRNERECEVLVVRDQVGAERSVWTWHAQLRYRLIAPKDELEQVLREGRARLVEPGDFVAIHYAGRWPMDNGKDAYRYRVAVDKVDAAAETLPDGGEPDTPDDIPFP
jgi:hypothetical protein